MKVKTLIRLAYSNLYSHKRTYCLMGAIIILISSILMCAQILYTNQYYTQKKIDQDNYGTWFLMYVDIDEKNFNDNVNEINHLKLGENYHFIRNYGTTQYLENIGKIHDNAFDQFGIHLIDINKEDLIEKKGITSVIVNKQFFENHQLSQKVNQTASLEFTDINNQKKFMDIYISGIYESKEHLRQKIYLQ